MRVEIRSIAALWTLLLCAKLYARPPIQGRAEQQGDIQLVHVHGSYEEMGRAHGYLLAGGILRNAGSAAEFFFGTPEAYEQAMTLARAVVEFPENARRELEGILNGVQERLGGVARVAFLNRDLNIDDLILLNSMDMLRGFGCSGFTVWGDKAGDAGVITARNFDFGVMGKVEAPLVLIRSPEGKRSTATVAGPGYIGAYTGFNDDGVCAFMHDGTGGRIREPQGRYTPLAIALQSLLEDAGSPEALILAEKRLKAVTPYPFSYMVRVVTRRTAGNERPARVFQVDKHGLSENPMTPLRCVTTNHYLTAIDTGVLDANRWSVTRYDRLVKQIDTPATTESAWRALQSVEALDGRQNVTLHSLVVYPERGQVEIAFASEKDGTITPAPRNKPAHFKFDTLFSKK